jgi:hypothetical protein
MRTIHSKNGGGIMARTAGKRKTVKLARPADEQRVRNIVLGADTSGGSLTSNHCARTSRESECNET